MKIPLTLIQSEAKRVADTRECGTCTACCVLPRIHAQADYPEGKLGYVPCKHLCSLTGGCSIYEQRPEVCRAYTCMWRAGIINGDDRRRPDKLGLMFVPEVCDDKMMVEAWELWEGAARDYPGRGVIEAVLATTRFRVMIRFYGVPASVIYRGPETFNLGQQLSGWAGNNPQKLAEWLIHNTKSGLLEMPSDVDGDEANAARKAAIREVEELICGNCVTPYYRP